MSETVFVGLPAGESVIADFLDANGHWEQAQQLRGVAPVLYLWRLSQTETDGYDTYDSCMVVASTESEARLIHPQPADAGWSPPTFDPVRGAWIESWLTATDHIYCPNNWASHPRNVMAECIGVAVDREAGEVVCASFNAG